MSFLASLAGPALGGILGLVGGNVQNKANAQAATNAQNQAFAQQQQAQANNEQYLQKQLNSAMGNFSQYNQANPNPIYSTGAIHAPVQAAGGRIGGGITNGQGFVQPSAGAQGAQGQSVAPQGMPPQQSAQAPGQFDIHQLLAMLMQHYGGQQNPLATQLAQGGSQIQGPQSGQQRMAV